MTTRRSGLQLAPDWDPAAEARDGRHLGLPRAQRPRGYRGECLDCSWVGPLRSNGALARSDVRAHADAVAEEWKRRGQNGGGES